MPETEAFGPDLIDEMQAAFHETCARLGLTLISDKATELVASKIVELAKAGLRGLELKAAAIRYFDHSADQNPSALRFSSADL